MEIVKLDEAGYQSALHGIALSFQTPEPETPLRDYLNSLEDSRAVAARLKDKDRGHNKFLEQIETWWAVRAPLTWWQQFDQYRHAQEGIDESVTQSESTMHTLMRRDLHQTDFERFVDGPYLDRLNGWRQGGLFQKVSDGLPRSFLQARIVKLNYQVLRNILIQRSHHKLEEWQQFCQAVLAQVEHPDLLPE